MDTDNIETKARQLLDGRIDSVNALAQALAHRDKLRREIDSAEREVSSAWTQATQTGWTAGELRTLGFSAPAKGSTNRSSARTPRRAPKDAAPTHSDVPEPS